MNNGFIIIIKCQVTEKKINKENEILEKNKTKKVKEKLNKEESRNNGSETDKYKQLNIQKRHVEVLERLLNTILRKLCSIGITCENFR